MSRAKNSVTPDKFDAVLFDLDGVVTGTAKVHATCWKLMFDQARVRISPWRAAVSNAISTMGRRKGECVAA